MAVEIKDKNAVKDEVLMKNNEPAKPNDQNIVSKNPDTDKKVDAALKKHDKSVEMAAAPAPEPVRQKLVLARGSRLHRGGRLWTGDTVYNVSEAQAADLLGWETDGEPVFKRYKPKQAARRVDPQERLADGSLVEEYLKPEAAIAPTQAIALRQEIASAEEMAELYSGVDDEEDEGVPV